MAIIKEFSLFIVRYENKSSKVAEVAKTFWVKIKSENQREAKLEMSLNENAR
jgi:hypothetical protein